VIRPCDFATSADAWAGSSKDGSRKPARRPLCEMRCDSSRRAWLSLGDVPYSFSCRDLGELADWRGMRQRQARRHAPACLDTPNPGHEVFPFVAPAGCGFQPAGSRLISVVFVVPGELQRPDRASVGHVVL
jgi:hypothetical protein